MVALNSMTRIRGKRTKNVRLRRLSSDVSTRTVRTGKEYAAAETGIVEPCLHFRVK